MRDMMVMRVLLVFSSSELGGAERSLTRMALVARGRVQYELATLDGEGPWVDWCRSLGRQPLVFGTRDQAGHGHFGSRALWRLVREVWVRRYDVVYVIGLRAAFALRCLKPLLRGARLVHGVRWNPNSESNLDQAFRVIERTTAWLVDAYICNSRAAARTLTDRLGVDPAKVHLVYNGVAVAPGPQSRYSERPASVLTVANLSERKGHLEYLERVIPPLCRQFPAVRFVFAGRDEMAGKVQARIAELGLESRVSYAGFQPDVTRFLDAARVFVLPSLKNEGTPTSILEAMAFALPIVAFELNGIPELVTRDVDGIVVPLPDHAAMAEAIAGLLADLATSESMGRRGREKVLREFTIEQCAARHDEVLLGLGPTFRTT